MRSSALAPWGAALALLVASTALAVPVGDAAPDFTVTASDGTAVTLSGLRGKVVLVDFWASWCRPCREAFPTLDRLARDYRARGLVVVGLSQDDSEAQYRSFVASHPVSFVLARDVRHVVAGRYAPPAMPTTYLVDRAGKIRFVQRGYREAHVAQLVAQVERWLATPAP